jgi:NADH dehydrogenase [ubiquinone] 1 alpha subcomplex assembly factor 3
MTEAVAEILLFGTGRTVVPPPKEIKDYVSSLGIQLDVMDSVSPLA